MRFRVMEKRPRAAATTIPPQAVYNYVPDWRPWQLSPYLLIPLTLMAAGLAAALEVLTQISNRAYDDSDLRTAWLDWYCEGRQRSSCLPESDITGFSLSDMTFENISSSKTGILAFPQPNSPSAVSTFTWLFTWLHFPMVSAVLYAVVWQVVDDEVKRIEPFYQSSRPGGAKGNRTIFASYISIPPILAPLQALRWRQTAVFLSSITYVLVGFVTPILQSQIFQLQPQMVQVGYFPRFSHRFEPLTQDGWKFSRQAGDGPIIARFSDEMDTADRLSEAQNQGVVRVMVHLDPTFARAQEAVLWAATVSGLLLFWVTMRRRSGMVNDTKGLGALASLASGAGPEFLHRVSTMAGLGGPDAEDVLKDTVVYLACGDDGGRENGDAIGPSTYYGFRFGSCPSGQPSSGMWRALAALVTAPKTFGASVLRWALGSSGAHYKVLHYSLILSIVGNLVLIIMIMAIGGTKKSPTSAYEVFEMAVRSTAGNSVTTTAVELIVVSVVKTLWVVVEAQTTALSPYRALHTHACKAWPLLERDYAAIVPGARTFYAFKDGQLLLGCVTAISLMLEVGLVCFGITYSMSQGRAYNTDAMWILHWISFTICVAIILFIFATSHIWLTGFPHMERNPDTIAGNLSYMCRSTRLLKDVRRLIFMTRREREAHLRGIKGLYAMEKLQSGAVRLERRTDMGQG
ncbi:hypothetical protein B0T14DRAFT_522356 [Immersiella caudata]|uniref:Uncharacterized protein n=1 Tax=Immersiella caudata TaxID=314043 RepID=A0AA39WSV9_9PEZI|nr:hypothetical protein B0T14DRAFT_522356 [Immersiella caudata]